MRKVCSGSQFVGYLTLVLGLVMRQCRLVKESAFILVVGRQDRLVGAGISDDVVSSLWVLPLKSFIAFQ